MLGQKFVPNVVPSKKQKILPKVTVNQEVILQNYSPDLECTSQSSSRSTTPTESGLSLDQMPYDVLFNIMAHLDLRSLYRCGQVCRTLHHIVAVDSLLYAELNLKPYWACASSALLQSLKKRLELGWVRDLESRYSFELLFQVCLYKEAEPVLVWTVQQDICKRV